MAAELLGFSVGNVLTRIWRNSGQGTMKSNHNYGETGLTFYYKMIRLHVRSQLDLDLEQLATILISRMNPIYKTKFNAKA